jgi:hydrogenase expression/formation protein HypE
MKKKKPSPQTITNSTVLRAHGAGGRMTHELIQQVFKPAFSNPVLNTFDDAAAVALAGNAGTIAFTTDSFVVHPLFFPGGDIGRLSVCGTVNDLAMKGAVPVAIAVAAIIEEGFPMADLTAITRSLAAAAREAGVAVVTGDTKVVEKGKADGLFLTTAGIGTIPRGRTISGSAARPGDAVLINGSIGDHGIAVLAARHEFNLTSAITSDCAPLNNLVHRLLAAAPDIHVLRDPTRGGVATTLVEIATASRVGIIIDEAALPVRPAVRAACNLLGIDPLYAANEGKVLIIAPAGRTPVLTKTLRKNRYGTRGTAIGRVVAAPRGLWLKTTAGGLRPLTMMEGDQLPRIC